MTAEMSVQLAILVVGMSDTGTVVVCIRAKALYC